MWQIKKITKYQQKLDLLAIFSVAIFLILALFVPNVKIFFVLAFGFFSFLTLCYSFSKAFVYATMPLTYVSLAQTYPILVIPAKAIVTNQYWEGRHLVFGFYPYLFISFVALFLTFIWKSKFKKKIPLTISEKLILITLSCGVLSAFYGSLIPWLSLFSVLLQFLSIVWIWYFVRLLNNQNNKQQQKLFLTLFGIFVSLTIFESLIVFKQTISSSPVGLAIEKTGFAPSFGAGSDENSGEFRPFGLQAHPNGLANKQLILGFSTWLLYQQLKLRKKTRLAHYLKKTLIAVIVLVIINIILSLSRAVFLSLSIGVLHMFLKHKKEWFRVSNELKTIIGNISTKYLLLLLVIGFFLVFKLSIRMINSIYSFSEFGGITTRIEQYKEAIEVFKKSPIFGIGDEMFIPTSYQLFPKGIMSYFPENVHNGFLLFLIERGILGIITYSVFFIFLLTNIHKSKMSSLEKNIVYSGIMATFTVMMFHPERNFFNVFLLLTLGLAQYKHEKKIPI